MSRLHALYARDLLDNEQAAEYAGVAKSTIRQWVHRGLLEPAMREQLQKIIAEDFPDIIGEVFEKERKKLRQAFRANLRASYENKLKWELDRHAREAGERLANETIRDMRQELKL